MHDDYPVPAPTFDRSHATAEDFDLRCSTGVAAARDQLTLRTHARVFVRPANAVDRGQPPVPLQASELSPCDVLGIAELPVMVGSVYHLEFDRTAADVPATLATLIRCTMLGDASFELRFRFLQRVELPRTATRTP
jgi:hypothetical protein